MKVEDKKLSMADKMYKQNSSEGKIGEVKNYMHGKETNKNKKGMKFDMHGKGTGYGKGEKAHQSDSKGSFVDKYSQADAKGSMKGGYKM